jgi:hypothetical protein
VKSAQLSHTSSSLQEHKDSLAHARSQLASTQDNLTGQLKALQQELAATQNDKLQADREVGRLSQEGARAAGHSLAEPELAMVQQQALCFCSLQQHPCHGDAVSIISWIQL